MSKKSAKKSATVKTEPRASPVPIQPPPPSTAPSMPVFATPQVVPPVEFVPAAAKKIKLSETSSSSSTSSSDSSESEQEVDSKPPVINAKMSSLPGNMPQFSGLAASQQSHVTLPPSHMTQQQLPPPHMPQGGLAATQPLHPIGHLPQQRRRDSSSSSSSDSSDSSGSSSSNSSSDSSDQENDKEVVRWYAHYAVLYWSYSLIMAYNQPQPQGYNV